MVIPSEVLFIFKDLHDAWAAIEPVDFAKPSFIGLWLILLLTPLKGVDRRDLLAALVYTLFCMASAVILVFILPETFSPPEPMLNIFATTVFLSLLAFARWNFRVHPVKDFVKTGFEKGQDNGAAKTKREKQRQGK